MLLTDMFAIGLDYKIRLSLFTKVLLAVLEVIPCLTIHWQPSQHFVNPDKYRSALLNAGNVLFGAVNVRLFRVENRTPGDIVMDTLGLHAFGLPGLQCHFNGLDEQKVARLLYNTSVYVFEKGDVIADGHTLGFTPKQRWVCRHAKSLVEPKRVVIDINPGKPYAAGNRTPTQKFLAKLANRFKPTSDS